MSDHSIAQAIPDEIKQQLLEWNRQYPLDGPWLRWVLYCQVGRRVYHNYAYVAANALRELRNHCHNKILAGEIEKLQLEFEDLSRYASWLCMSAIAAQRGRVHIGEYVRHTFVEPSRDPLRAPIEERAEKMTLQAGKLLLLVVAEESELVAVEHRAAVEQDLQSPAIPAQTPVATVSIFQDRPAPQDSIDKESLAIALLYKRSDLSLAGIADTLGVERQTPYKWPTFLKAAELVGKYTPRPKGGGHLPSGTKSREGNVEAWDDSRIRDR
jgi:hypothetical protein